MYLLNDNRNHINSQKYKVVVAKITLVFFQNNTSG